MMRLTAHVPAIHASATELALADPVPFVKPWTAGHNDPKLSLMSRRKKWLLGLGAAAVAAGTAFQFQRLLSEEPSYEVVRRTGKLEIRQYGPRIVARTRMTADGREGSDSGFRVLAGYIFGGNEKDASIAMTTPVTTEASGSQRIAMTTPVETTADEDGRYMTFTMPSEYDMESLPRPTDPRVELVEMPGRRVASLRFSGRVSSGDAADKQQELLDAVRDAGLTPCGEPFLAQYDPPWVLGVFRRNEVQVPIDC